MRVRYFVLGLLVGLLLAPASGRQLWRRLRDQLAAAIDALLRLIAPRRELRAVQRTLTPL
jgi:gas vesicle protein